MNSFDTLRLEAGQFLEKIHEHLTRDDIDVSRAQLDHICYRVETTEEYEHMRRLLSDEWEPLIENMIGGRLIATYRLRSPIVYQDREIYLIELPSPKAGSHYPTGWEHAEFAVGDEWTSLEERYHHIGWDRRGMEKLINPELSRRYPDGLSVKFHELPLDVVIERYERE